MSKFAKRIKKLNKKSRNILVAGSAWGNLSELTDSFGTIFLIDDKKRILRSKNIVYRENFDNISHLYDVDVVLIDLDHENHITELLPLLKRWNSLIVIEGPALISQENQRFLKSHNYQIVDVYKNYYVWKLR